MSYHNSILQHHVIQVLKKNQGTDIDTIVKNTMKLGRKDNRAYTRTETITILRFLIDCGWVKEKQGEYYYD